jgi:hypothetical protein
LFVGCGAATTLPFFSFKPVRDLFPFGLARDGGLFVNFYRRLVLKTGDGSPPSPWLCLVVCFVFRWFAVMVSFKNWIFDLVWLLFLGG